MNRQQTLSLVAIGLSLLSIFYGPVAAVAASAPAVYDSAQEESVVGVWVATGHGTSMEPTMSPGDRALCVAYIEPEIGSVVAVDGAALGNSHDVRHRVVQLNETHVATKGDNRDSRDDVVPRQAVRCTVVYSEGAGWWP